MKDVSFIKSLLPWFLSPRVSSPPPLLTSLVKRDRDTRRGTEDTRYDTRNEDIVSVLTLTGDLLLQWKGQ